MVAVKCARYSSNKFNIKKQKTTPPEMVPQIAEAIGVTTDPAILPMKHTSDVLRTLLEQDG